MAESHSSKLIAVLGGGIAGLSAARRLTVLGHRVRLFEQAGRIGGVVRSEAAEGWLVECGPNSLQEGSEEMAGWWRELGLEGERVVANPLAKNRYLVRGGRLVPVPMSPGAFFTTPLFSARAKARLLAEIFSRKRTRTEDASVGDFMRDHFGAEIVDFAVQPMISGIYAGDPARLCAREVFPQLWEMERTHGSLLRGQIAAAKAKRAAGKTSIAKIISFRQGLQAFPDAIAARLPAGSIALNSRVDRLVPESGWKVEGRNPSGDFTEKFDSVVDALPAQAVPTVPTRRQSASIPLSSLTFLSALRVPEARPESANGSLLFGMA